MGFQGAASKTGVPTATELAGVVVVKGAQSTPIPVVPGTGGGTAAGVTRVAANVAAVTLLAANANRISCSVYNNSTQNLALKLGANPDIGAGTESFTCILLPGGFFRTYEGEYNGQITGIWYAADASGEALITEVT